MTYKETQVWVMHEEAMEAVGQGAGSKKEWVASHADSVIDGDGGLRCTTPAWRRGAPISSLTSAEEGLSSAPGSAVLAGFQRSEVSARGWAHPT